MHCALPMPKLVEVLADMSLVCSELQTHSIFPLYARYAVRVHARSAR